MREVLSIHIGQAGIQIGSSVWELLCSEHGMKHDGTLDECVFKSNDYISTFFSQGARSDRYVPRSIFVDLEPSVIDAIKASDLSKLFHPDLVISGKEDAANNYARGRYNVGRTIVEQVAEKIRGASENCDSLQGFMIYHSLGGGTGSGFRSLLLDRLSNEFKKVPKLEFSVYPSPHISSSVVEPYNSVLTTHATMETSDCSFVLDNQAIYDICRQNLKVVRPSYKNINQIIAQAASSISASIRFKGTLNIDMNEYQTNLVPYPRLHFPSISYAPMFDTYKASCKLLSIKSLTNSCFLPASQMVKSNVQNGKYMSVCLLYRGDVNAKDVNAAILDLKNNKTVQFVDWCATGFKIGINYEPPASVKESVLPESPNAVCMLSNSTALGEVWARLNNKFNVMYAKRAFIHWYVGEGMEESEFTEAKEDLVALEMDYAQMTEEPDKNDNSALYYQDQGNNTNLLN